MVGETLGNYRVLDKIGEGGMGTVYLAEHTLIGRKAAVKLLRPELSKDEAMLERFFNEAKAAAKIQHPGIVDVLDFGRRDDGSAFIVMECLEGEGLRERLERTGPMEPDAVIRIARQAASALVVAHEVGIIHRDLKPDNLFLVIDAEVAGGERIKVLDFGIAKLAPTIADARYKTSTGSLMGSPTYMSPEQCRGAGGVDHRTDIYSLGCVVYEMLSGGPPFDGEGVGDILGKHMYQPVQPLAERSPTVPAGVESVVLHMLEKDPDNRYQSMSEVVTALDRASDSRFATAPVGRVAPIPSGAKVHTPEALSLTTLGGAAAEVTLQPTRPRGRRNALFAIGAIAALGAGIASVLLLRDSGGGAESSLSEPVVALPEPSTQPGREAPPDPTPATISHTVRSTPTGASVYDHRGVRIGETPFDERLEPGTGARTLVLKAEGYENFEVSLDLAHDSHRDVELVRTRAAKQPKRTGHRNKRKRVKKPHRSKGDPIDPFAEP